MIRRGEVDFDRETFLEASVVVKLGAVVERDRLELCAMTANGSRCRSCHFVHLACPELFDDRVSGLALDQCEHAVAHVTSHHRVTLPMPDALAQFDLYRPVAYRPFAGQHPA